MALADRQLGRGRNDLHQRHECIVSRLINFGDELALVGCSKEGVFFHNLCSSFVIQMRAAISVMSNGKLFMRSQYSATCRPLGFDVNVLY